jgi:predicted transcriptional regulator
MNQEHPSAAASRADLQRAFLLDQLAGKGTGGQRAGALNKRIPVAARRELGLGPDAANVIRRELLEQGYLEVTRNGRKISYRLTEAGRKHLAGLERPALGGRALRPEVVNEDAITDEVREGQKAYLLLQLLDADGRPLPKGEANRFPRGLATSLGLKPGLANHRRARLAEQNYIRVTSEGRSEAYCLTRDGLDYLAAGARYLEHAAFTVRGKTLNALTAAAREALFDRDRPGAPVPSGPPPRPAELAEAVLTEFEDLRRERHGRSGLVPIYEVRQRLVERFGPAAGRHDLLDEVLLGLWRAGRLGLEAISDLADATEQQLNDSIQGAHGTLFYLEAPREQPVAPEPL